MNNEFMSQNMKIYNRQPAFTYICNVTADPPMNLTLRLISPSLSFSLSFSRIRVLLKTNPLNVSPLHEYLILCFHRSKILSFRYEESAFELLFCEFLSANLYIVAIACMNGVHSRVFTEVSLLKRCCAQYLYIYNI